MGNCPWRFLNWLFAIWSSSTVEWTKWWLAESPDYDRCVPSLDSYNHQVINVNTLTHPSPCSPLYWEIICHTVLYIASASLICNIINASDKLSSHLMCVIFWVNSKRDWSNFLISKYSQIPKQGYKREKREQKTKQTDWSVKITLKRYLQNPWTAPVTSSLPLLGVEIQQGVKRETSRPVSPGKWKPFWMDRPRESHHTTLFLLFKSRFVLSVMLQVQGCIPIGMRACRAVLKLSPWKILSRDKRARHTKGGGRLCPPLLFGKGKPEKTLCFASLAACSFVPLAFCQHQWGNKRGCWGVILEINSQ